MGDVDLEAVDTLGERCEGERWNEELGDLSMLLGDRLPLDGGGDLGGIRHSFAKCPSRPHR